jgi:hypothetical protein
VSGATGTREREEKITGAVGVKNKKGELVDHGSTTGPKGGKGIGDVSQGKPTGVAGSMEADEE